MYDDLPTSVADRTAELAGRAVALAVTDHEDAQEVLRALGLWDRLRDLREAEAS